MQDVGSRVHRKLLGRVVIVMRTAVRSAAYEVARMDQYHAIDVEDQPAEPVTAMADESVARAGYANVLPGFLAEIARAMQAAAERERARIAEVVAGEAAEHVEKARTRAAAESEELRRLAEEDVARIQDWSASEIERIRGEADARAAERRNELEAYLARHESIITTEIDGVDTAVQDYRASLDRFFEELTGSSDPADIARRAGWLPDPPDLDAVRAAARAAAVERFANAQQDDMFDSAGDEPGGGVDPGAWQSTALDEGDEPSGESGTGMGVMDPEADGRSADLPTMPGDVDAEPGGEPAAVPAGEGVRLPDYDREEVAVQESAHHSSPAVRLLRSISPWTNSADRHDPDEAAQAR